MQFTHTHTPPSIYPIIILVFDCLWGCLHSRLSLVELFLIQKHVIQLTILNVRAILNQKKISYLEISDLEETGMFAKKKYFPLNSILCAAKAAVTPA